MGRAPCCDKANVKKGPWSPEEDAKLKAYIDQNGTGGNWIALPQKIGLKRCGKSCRLRWLNYLRPNLKHGGFSDEEDNIICSLYMSIGSRWSIIAAQLPGRTDNDIKNYWNTRLKKKLLGKQRKEARRSATLNKKQDQDHEAMMKMSTSTQENHNYFMAVPAAVGHGSMMMMMMNPNQTPYWHCPGLHDLPPPPPAMIMPDHHLVHNNQDSIKNLLIKLGVKFSKEPNTTHFDPNIETINYSNNMVSSASFDSQFPSPDYDPYMLHDTIYDPVELIYGNEQLLDNNFYGVNSMINDGTTGTGTSSSENSSNYVISPLDFQTNNYEASCQQQQLQQDQSRYCFGLQ